MGKTQRVLPRKDGWAVKGDGNSRDTSHHERKEDAVKEAIKIAKNQGSEVVIHGRNGQIQSKDSYGNDPNPPRDKEH